MSWRRPFGRGGKEVAMEEQLSSTPAFLSVLDHESTAQHSDSWLPIPPRFVRLYASRITTKCRIVGPDGACWNVSVGGESLGSIGLRKGWKCFVIAYGLKDGDFVVVRLVDDSFFHAEIFGRKSLTSKIPEKTEPRAGVDRGQPSRRNASRSHGFRDLVPVAKSRKRQECQELVEHRRERYLCERYERPEATPSSKSVVAAGRKRKKDGEKACNSFSTRRPVTDLERQRALHRANRFSSKNPFCVMVMRQSHVYRGFWMGIRCKFAKDYLPGDNREIILMDSSGQKWPARWLGTRLGLSAGWKRFAQDHFLEEDDVVIFERVSRNSSKLMLRVHIYRVVELDENEEQLDRSTKKRKMIARDEIEGSDRNSAKRKAIVAVVSRNPDLDEPRGYAVPRLTW